MIVKIEELIDYTLKRKGDRMYSLIDENGAYLKGCGATGWRTKKACMKRLQELGYEYGGMITKHQCYSHWADFVPAKLEGWQG